MKYLLLILISASFSVNASNITHNSTWSKWVKYTNIDAVTTVSIKNDKISFKNSGYRFDGRIVNNSQDFDFLLMGINNKSCDFKVDKEEYKLAIAKITKFNNTLLDNLSKVSTTSQTKEIKLKENTLNFNYKKSNSEIDYNAFIVRDNCYGEVRTFKKAISAFDTEVSKGNTLKKLQQSLRENFNNELEAKSLNSLLN